MIAAAAAMTALTVAAFSFAVAGEAWASSCTTRFAPGSQKITLLVSGSHRSAVVHVPGGVSHRAVPLVLALHGAWGTGTKMERYSGFSRLADRYQFIVVYPSADGAFWNSGAIPRQPDDVAFLKSLIAYVERRGCVDSTRVFMTGVSNGGGMAALAACRLSPQISAVAPVAGATDDQPSCHPSEPVSVLEIHGTADQVVPYFGRAHRRTSDGLPPYVNGWARRDACAGRPSVRAIATRTKLYEWDDCTSGVLVEHIQIENGRHQWPGATPPDPGPPATICASCRVWSFFSGLRTPVRKWSSSGGAGL